MLGLWLMLDLSWVHNNNYTYMVLLILLLSSFSQLCNRHQIADDRAHYVIPHDLWINFQLRAANYISEKHLSLSHTSNSSCGLAGRLLLYDKVFSYYWWPHRFINKVTTNHAGHSLWCTAPDFLHECLQLPLEFITRKTLIQNFTNYTPILYCIVTSFV